MTTRSFTPTEFHPTSPRSGNDGHKVFRMQNMILRGLLSSPYAEVYGGSLDLGEEIPTGLITGTILFDTLSLTVIGSVGTRFKTELHPGQFLEAFLGAVREPMVVDNIIDDGHFTLCRYPTQSATGAAVFRFPVIFDLNKYRGTMIRGNATETDLGTILAVGDGTLRRNGVVLPGTSLVASRTPKIALYNAATNTFTVFTLGMATPATLTAAGVAGTGKNMPAGLYSGRAVAARLATRGYNNPSPKAEVTLTAGQQIQFTFPAADTANGQDAWMIFVSLASPSITGPGVQGPWYRYELPAIYIMVGAAAGQIPAAGGTYNVEYNDAEIDGNDILTFNNDAPPHAEFVAYMSGIPIWISTNGPGYNVPITAATNANPVVFTTSFAHMFSPSQRVAISGGTGAWAAVNNTWTITILSATTFSIPVDSTAFGALAGTVIVNSIESSPGPFIRPAKPRNIEAAPAGLAVSASPAETIIGYVLGSRGRLYLMCVNSLQIAIPTQSLDPRIPPFVVRPFWECGFANPETLLFVGDVLIGMTSNGLARSISEGDVGSEEFGFAIAMEELLRNISPGHCLLKLDPKNNAVVLFHSGHNRNVDGFWTTRAWMYGLRENRWIGDILLTSSTSDMIVSSATVVSGRLEFLMGGRTAAGTTVVKTYRWDEPVVPGTGTAIPIPYYIAWDFSDWGVEDRCKAVKMLSVTGRQVAGGTAGIHGAAPGEPISAAVLEAGNSGSKSGTILLPITSSIRQAFQLELDVDELKQLTIRVDGTWDGVGEKDRIDEVVVDAIVRGGRR